MNKLKFSLPIISILFLTSFCGGSATVVSPIADSARVYPNPWRVDQHSTLLITFDHMSLHSTVKIFTVSGRLVRTLDADAGSTTWDRKNDDGDLVASGIYLYLLSDGQGNETKGKLAIIK